MRRKLRHLLLVTLEDPWNPGSWSGIPFNMRVALEGQVEKLSILAGLKPRRNPKDVALRIILGGKPPRYPLFLTAASQRHFAKQTAAAIRDLQPDAVLSISSHCVVRLDPPNIPVFMFMDAPWIAWKRTYGDYIPLLGARFAQLEAEAAQRCTGVILASEWASKEAQRLFEMSPNKLHVQPMGANWVPDLTSEELDASIDSRPSDCLDLLYVGKDWERKGGPLAVEIASGLRAAGAGNIRLHIVGCTPEIPSEARDIVTVHGLLKAAIPEQAAKLRQLFLKSHFLIVPTRAECFGLVFAEASAFGLPAISRDVQAVPSIISDGKTGILEPANASAAPYISRILSLAGNREEYRNMARAARHRYESALSWGTFIEGIVNVMETNS